MSPLNWDKEFSDLPKLGTRWEYAPDATDSLTGKDKLQQAQFKK